MIIKSNHSIKALSGIALYGLISQKRFNFILSIRPGLTQLLTDMALIDGPGSVIKNSQKDFRDGEVLN